jgi:hypothetical protein
MYQHLQGVPQPLERLRPALAKEHPGLEAIVMRLLAREREQRFPSAAAFLEATAPQHPAPERPALRFVTVVEKSPAQVPSPPSRSAVSKWVWAAALAVVGLGIFAGVWLWQSKPATAVPELSPPGGTYAEAQSVVITDANPNAVIHFTTDGSLPTEASPIYLLPISSLPSGGVVRAMATAPGRAPSSEVNGVYTWASAKLPAAKPPESLAYDQGKAAYDQKDYAKARTLFTQACNGDNMNACNYLGAIYDQGQGVKADDDTARKIYQKSCDQGNMLGCNNLGTVLQNLGNNTEARKYFKKACDGKLKEACDVLSGAQ